VSIFIYFYIFRPLSPTLHLFLIIFPPSSLLTSSQFSEDFPHPTTARDSTFYRKIPVFFKQALNTGDDIAGIVHSVGSNVYEFQKGDRVASFHEMMKPHGSFAEYAVGWAHTTFKLPKKTSFEGA
jgi:hypothetical protein